MDSTNYSDITAYPVQFLLLKDLINFSMSDKGVNAFLSMPNCSVPYQITKFYYPHGYDSTIHFISQHKINHYRATI